MKTNIMTSGITHEMIDKNTGKKKMEAYSVVLTERRYLLIAPKYSVYALRGNTKILQKAGIKKREDAEKLFEQYRTKVINMANKK